MMRVSTALTVALAAAAALVGGRVSPAVAVGPPVPSPRLSVLVPNDRLWMAELRFSAPHSALGARRLSARAIGLPAGDYMVLAAPHPTGHGRLRAILLAGAETEPPPLRWARVLVRHPRKLGRVSLSSYYSVLGDLPATLCSIARERPMHGSDLEVLAASGKPPAGLSPGEAAAQAIDGGCGLGGWQTLAADLGRSEVCNATSCPGVPRPAPPTPEPVPPVPEPVPPMPGPPRCSPCNPAPGTACPLVASIAVCVAGKDEIAPATAAGAH